MKIIYNVCKKTLMVALLAMLFQFTATIGMGEPVTVLADKSEETVKFKLSYHQIDDKIVTIPIGYYFMFDTTDSLPEGITLQDCITIGDMEIASFDGSYRL